MKADIERKAGEQRVATGEVEIDAPVDRVWRALTEAAELERWFPLEARVKPGVGGSVWMSWGNEFAGASEILAWDPPRLLRTAWKFHPGDGAAQITEYALESRGGRTHLRVVTSGFPADASWDEWVEGTVRGWRFELESLRTYVERHAGRDRAVVYLRRRMEAPTADLWARLFGPDGLGGAPPGGEPFDVAPPYQYAARLDDPPGGMLRISIEPAGVTGAERDVTFWLSDWSGSAGRCAVLSAGWTRLLERLFPEGRTV
jgi:uncharacterized protein YndB with AHSA1/START domain